MSVVSSEYTEQTVEEPPYNDHYASTTTNPDPPSRPRATKVTPPSVAPPAAAPPHVSYAAETPARVPVAKKSFFQTVGEVLTGGSQNNSDNSDVSSHMRPSPRKYYGRAGTNTTTVETESESSGSL